MKRKILAGLLSLCMMVSLVPTTVFAETAKTLPVAKVDRADGMVTITSGDEADTRHFDGSYVVYDLLGTGAGNSSSSEPFDLQIAMDFEAIDKTSEAAQATGYGDYITDFFITFDGLENDSFVADNCYLAGYYADVDMWVQIPLYGFTVNEGTLYPVITSAGFDWSYETICTVVEKFTCGIFLDEEILEENPDIEVTLTLGLIDPEVYSGPLDVKEDIIVVVDDFTYGLEDLVECEAKIGERYYTTLEAAVAAGGEVTLLKDAEIETTLKVKKDVKLDLNGWTLTAPHNYNNGGQNLYGFIVEEGATLTLDDSSEAQTGEISCKYSGIETKGGTFVMDGGKITSADLTMAVAVVNYGGSVVINDGTINAYDAAFTTMAYFTSSAKTEVKGGKINLVESENNFSLIELGGQYNNGTAEVVISGGDFRSNTDYNFASDDSNGTIAAEITGGTYSAEPEEEYVANGYVVVDNTTYFEVKLADDLEHEVEVVVPEIREEIKTTQTTVSQEAQKEVADIGNNLVDAIKDAATESDDDKIAEVIKEAVKDLNLEDEHHDDVVEALVEAVKNNDEITITLTVDSTPVPEQVENASTEIAEMKDAIEEAGLVVDENSVVLEITVTKTISTSSEGVVEEKELSELAAPITHTVVFPEVPDVVEGMQRVWTMYSYHEGNVIPYPVKDNGDGTGTFASSLYSYYLLAYEVVPVAQASEHNWSDDFKMNDEYHWRYCKSCGIKKTRHPHVDVNKDGSCDACDYRVTSTGRENPVTGVTADMLK